MDTNCQQKLSLCFYFGFWFRNITFKADLTLEFSFEPEMFLIKFFHEKYQQKAAQILFVAFKVLKLTANTEAKKRTVKMFHNSPPQSWDVNGERRLLICYALCQETPKTWQKLFLNIFEFHLYITLGRGGLTLLWL